jgi:hypothetical protein
MKIEMQHYEKIIRISSETIKNLNSNPTTKENLTDSQISRSPVTLLKPLIHNRMIPPESLSP